MHQFLVLLLAPPLSLTLMQYPPKPNASRNLSNHYNPLSVVDLEWCVKCKPDHISFYPAGLLYRVHTWKAHHDLDLPGPQPSPQCVCSTVSCWTTGSFWFWLFYVLLLPYRNAILSALHRAGPCSMFLISGSSHILKSTPDHLFQANLPPSQKYLVKVLTLGGV